jgi:hypothetical protein
VIVASFFAPRYEKWPGCDYDKLLLLLDKSCRRFGLEHVVISDTLRPGLNTALYDLPAELMPAILTGQRNFLAATPGPVLLVGADCLLTKDPRPVLAGDITVTIGPFADCEMNTGAVWCASGARCAPAWDAALDDGPLEWGDDQRMLYEAIQESGLDVRKVRCEDHNAAPDNIDDDAGMPTVVHFRGRRKSWMGAWGQRYLGIAAPAA